MAQDSLYNVCRVAPHRWIGGMTDSKHFTALDLSLSKLLYSKLSLRQQWTNSTLDGAAAINPRYGRNFAIQSLAYSYDGKRLISGTNDGNIFIFNPNTGKRTHAINGAHGGSINCLGYMNDNQFISGSVDSTIALWDLRKLAEPINILRGHGSCIRELISNKNSKEMLLSSSMDNDIRYWHLPSFQSVDDALDADNDKNEEFRGVVGTCPNLSQLAVSPDNDCLTIVNSQGTMFVVYNVDIIELSKMLKMVRLDDGLVMQLAWFNPNCSLSKKNRIRILSSDEYTPPGQGVVSRVLGTEFHPQHCMLIMRVCFSHAFGLNSSEWTCGMNLHQKQSSFDASWLTIHSYGSEVIEETLLFTKREERHGLVDKKYSFSKCGRLFSSPGKQHVSLLAFSDELGDPFVCTKKKKPESLMSMFTGFTAHNSLSEVAVISLTEQVSCAKLSPTDIILAIGTEQGHVSFYQPHV